MPPKIQETSPSTRQPAVKSGVPGCVWLAAGLAMVLLIAVARSAAVSSPSCG